MHHSVKVKASVALCATTVLPSEDPRDLQPPAEGLVEEQPCLELRDEGEPRQHGNGQEDEEPHGVLVHPRHLLDGVPWSHLPKRSTGPLPELGTARTSACTTSTIWATQQVKWIYDQPPKQRST